MSVQPKLLTLDEYNPLKPTNPIMENLMYVQFLGKDELTAIHDSVLYAIIEKFKYKGEEEIIRMVDRGQIFQSQAKRVLGENRYEEIGKTIPCE